MNEGREEHRVPLLQGPKRQHFLPEFYLSGFCRGEGLWLYDRVRKQFRQQKPKDTAVVGHLYTVCDAENRQRFEIEAMMAKAEGNAAGVIRKLLKCEPITEDDRAAMAFFAGLAFTRTPERLGEVERMRAHMIEHTMKVMWGSKEGAAKLIAETGGAADSPWTPEELAQMINNGGFKAKIHNEAKIEGMLTMTDAVVPLLTRMTWVVAHRPSDVTSFITTDSPVRLLPPPDLPSGPYGVGFAMRGTQTLFPLSQEACLIMINMKGPPIHHIEMQRSQVRGINLTMAAGSYEYVIGRDEQLVRNVVERTGVDRNPIVSKLRIS